MSSQQPVKFDTVLIGLGRAGNELHIPILHKLANVNPDSPFSRVVGLVDKDSLKIKRAIHRLTDEHRYNEDDIHTAKTIRDLDNNNIENTIVHICTPATNHAATLGEAALAGYKRFVVEKPCAGNVLEVDEISKLRKMYDLNVAVINPYLYSRSVHECKRIISDRKTTPRYIEFELSKPRKKPTLLGRSTPESVFDVEIPHQIATVLYITGAKHYRVLRAEVRDMHYREDEKKSCEVVRNMGMGIIVLELDYCISILVSYLDAPTRTRVLKIRCQDDRLIEAYLPVTEDDHTAELVEYGPRGTDGSTEQISKNKLPDDLFTRCLSDIYLRFKSNSPHPSNPEFNRKVVDIMDKAKEITRVRR